MNQTNIKCQYQSLGFDPKIVVSHARALGLVRVAPAKPIEPDTKPKTLRQWGQTWNLIREGAKRMKQFSPSSFEPALTHSQAYSACRQLCAAGELKLLRKGRRSAEPVYQTTKA